MLEQTRFGEFRRGSARTAPVTTGAPSGAKAIPWSALLGGALAVALVATLWMVEYLPTNDGPNHVLLGYLSNHLDDAGKGYADFLKPSWPITSLGFQFLFSVLERAMPWRHALRAVLSLGALLWAFGFAHLAASLERRRVVLGLVGFATALSWNLYMGLFSYWLCAGASLWLIGYALRRPRWAWRDRLVLGGGLLAVV